MSAVVSAVPDKAALKQYRLSFVQRIPMIIWTFAVLEAATAVASAAYFLFTQVSWQTRYGTKTTTLFYAKDMWDRLPVHFDNRFGVAWFGHTQVEPSWWVTARHDTRHVMIGFLVALLIGAITIPIKNRKRATPAKMILSVPVAFFVAMIVAGGMIALFNYLAPFLSHIGTTTNNTFVQNLIGKGTLQLTIIGLVAGYAAKTVLKPTFDTIQLMSLERNIAQGDTEKWWWKIVYPPNYRNRFKYLVESGHECHVGSRWLGLVLSLGAPIFTLFLGVGVWVLYFGPAAHAH